MKSSKWHPDDAKRMHHSPSIADRKISNFVFVPSTDPKITSLKIDNQYTGDCLYDVVKGLCEENNIGFKIVLTDENKFAFSLYAGVDRSYEQTENPYVVFSPNFENIINSNYYSSRASFRNVTLVAGEGEGAARRTAIVGSAQGLIGVSFLQMLVTSHPILRTGLFPMQNIWRSFGQKA